MPKRSMNDMVPRNTVRRLPVKDPVPQPEPVHITPPAPAPVKRTRAAKVEPKPEIKPDPVTNERIKHAQDLLEQLHNHKHTTPVHIPKRRSSGGSRTIIWAVVVVALIILGLAALTLFSTAEITATLKTQPVSIDTTLVARKDDPAAELSYTTITKTVATSTVLALDPNAKPDPTARARGTVRLFNNNPTPQTLVRNTRLESKNGKIYRTQRELTIPARNSAGPGSVDIEVLSDVAGESGILLSKSLQGDFTLPGLRGTPRYQTIYGRQTDDITLPLTNGTLDETTARQQLIASAKAVVISEFQTNTPDGYVIFPNLVHVQSQSAEGESNEEGVVLAENITFTAALLKENDVAIALLPVERANILNGTLAVRSINTLTALLKNQSTYNPIEGTPILMSVNGTIHVHKPTAETALKQALAGKPLRQTESLITALPGVEKVVTNITPIWSWRYPSDFSRMRVQFVNGSTTQE